MAPARRSAPVGRRLLLVTLLVATVAVVVTALAAFGLLRSVDDQAARNDLASQADRLASARPAVRQALVTALSGLDDSELVALVSPNGAASGSGADDIPARVALQLTAGRSVSTSALVGGHTYLVEGRPAAGGGGVVLFQASDAVRTLAPALLWRVALALAIGLVVGAIAAVVVARTMSRPLTRLARRARRLASGERGIPAEPSGVSELDDVDDAIAALDAALDRSEGRQREFLLSISHEIRTPLTAVRGYAEAIADGVVPPEQLAEVGATLQAETARLTRFTDDLLALARVEADDFTLARHPVDVAGVLRDAADAWQAAAASADVTVSIAAPPDPVTLSSDAHRLRQLVDGLVENALRVSPAGSRIALSTSPRAGGGAVIEVRDDGPGLTPEDAAVAFQRGRLRERYRDSRPVGSGLGLSIAARLVDRMGGTIAAIPSDGGAVFRIELPDS